MCVGQSGGSVQSEACPIPFPHWWQSVVGCLPSQPWGTPRGWDVALRLCFPSGVTCLSPDAPTSCGFRPRMRSGLYNARTTVHSTVLGTWGFCGTLVAAGPNGLGDGPWPQLDIWRSQGARLGVSLCIQHPLPQWAGYPWCLGQYRPPLLRETHTVQTERLLGNMGWSVRGSPGGLIWQWGPRAIDMVATLSSQGSPHPEDPERRSLQGEAI